MAPGVLPRGLFISKSFSDSRQPVLTRLSPSDTYWVMSDNKNIVPESPDYWLRNRMEDSGYPERSAGLRLMHVTTGEVLTAQKQITLKMSMLAVADILAKPFNGVLKGDNHHRIFIEGTFEGQPVLAYVAKTASRADYDPDDDDEDDDDDDLIKSAFPEKINSLQIRIVGHRRAIAAGYEALEGLREYNFGSLQWWHTGQHGQPQHRVIYLPPLTTEIHPEYYPDLDGGPRQFIRDYLHADESVLLMAGVPGTGKTTLLRHMIMENSLTAHVVYDEKLMQSDTVFQTFLLNSNANILIIEDADSILTSRERDGNKLMSRFLNVSDGLIKLPNKKLIFTTNITDFGTVDPALLRPGRCYAVMQTRPLDLQEAQAASRVGGFPTPTEKKQYTLAELFNQGKSQHRVRRIGYT